MEDNSLSLVKIFCMSYNEKELLEDFLIYYGTIFGYENIIIIDHASTDPIVLEILSHYTQKGITVIYEKDTDRGKQHIFLTNAMIPYKNKCRFLLPLDTDEFFYVTNKSTDQIVPQDFYDFFNTLPEHVSKFYITRFMWSFADKTAPDYINYSHQSPARNITRFKSVCDKKDFEDIKERYYSKVFFRAEQFINIIHGNHNGQTVTNTGDRIDTCGLFHFHETGIKRKIEKAYVQMTRIKFIQENDTPEIAYQKLINTTVNWGRLQFYKTFLLKKIIINEYFNLYLHFPSEDLIELLVFELMDNPPTLVKKHIQQLHCPVIAKLYVQEKINALLYNEEKRNDIIVLKHIQTFLHEHPRELQYTL